MSHPRTKYQVQHFEQVISENPMYEKADIYKDEGISGTSIEKRKDFQRMIEDCKAGKIDLILTKSISRFGRNIVDITDAKERFGSRGEAQAKSILEQTQQLFAGGSLSEDDEIAFIHEIQRLYLDSKERAKKYTPKKYLRSNDHTDV